MFVVVDTKYNRIVIQSTVYMGHAMRSAGNQIYTYDEKQAKTLADAYNSQLDTENRFAAFQLGIV